MLSRWIRGQVANKTYMNIIQKLTSIAEGWANYVWDNPRMEPVARQRLEHCKTCEKVGHKAGIPYCKLCTCPIEAKVRSPAEACPKALWHSVKYRESKKAYCRFDYKEGKFL